jgi:hypothetical protein
MGRLSEQLSCLHMSYSLASVVSIRAAAAMFMKIRFIHNRCASGTQRPVYSVDCYLTCDAVAVYVALLQHLCRSGDVNTNAVPVLHKLLVLGELECLSWRWCFSVGPFTPPWLLPESSLLVRPCARAAASFSLL